MIDFNLSSETFQKWNILRILQNVNRIDTILMNKKYLYVIAAAIWGIPGIIITSKGIRAYRMQLSEDLWWLLMITVAVLVAFFLMFRRIVDRYCGRIASLPDKVRVWQTFPTRGWILLIFMMGLGTTLRMIPGIPSGFTASFYTGLGPMLLLSSFRFLVNQDSHR